MCGLWALLSIIVTLTPQPTWINENKVGEQVEKEGYQGDYSYQVRRNSTGSVAYVYQWWSRSPGGGPSSGWGPGILIVQAGRVARRIERPADVAYLNDEGEFVAWTDDLKAGVSIKGGTHVNVIPFYGRFSVDWAGRYFYNDSMLSGRTLIASIAQPTKILAVSNVFPYAIFSGANKIYLCGWEAPDKAGVSVCDVYNVSAQGAALAERRTIKNARVVYDLDPSTGRKLVMNDSEFFPGGRIVNLNGGSDESIGFAHHTSLMFLQPGVLPGS
jgi:hypothetical protein